MLHWSRRLKVILYLVTWVRNLPLGRPVFFCVLLCKSRDFASWLPLALVQIHCGLQGPMQSGVIHLLDSPQQIGGEASVAAVLGSEAPCVTIRTNSFDLSLKLFDRSVQENALDGKLQQKQ
ncbi:hypothetical protein U1Q18_027422 [Sarracenia purpurea var. burkii]